MISAHQVMLRAAAVVGGLLVVAATRMAASDTVVAVDVTVIVLAGLVALAPDTHVGLAAALVAVVHWVVAVDDATTAWSIAMALGLLVLHSSAAFASVAPVEATLDVVSLRRWGRRVAIAGATAGPVWLAVAVLARSDPGTSSVAASVALLVVAAGAVWAMRGRVSTTRRATTHGR